MRSKLFTVDCVSEKKSLEKFKKINSDLCILSMTPPNTDHSYGRLITKKDCVEKIIEIKLSDSEKNSFAHSVKSVKELFEAAKKIDSDLYSK